MPGETNRPPETTAPPAGETKHFPHGTTIDELGRQRGSNPFPPDGPRPRAPRNPPPPPGFGQAKAIERILLRLESIDSRLAEVQDVVTRLAGEQG